MTTESQPLVQERKPSAWWAKVRRQPSIFFTAVRFLTRIPVPDRLVSATDESAELLRGSAVYFPLVGSLIGAATASVIAGAAMLFSPWLAVLLGLVFEALLTGAFHEDAVADFCDAFGGGWTREDVLRILKDSRVGSFGALGLTLAVLLRAVATVELAPALQFAAVIASATLGRWLMLLVMTCVRPVPNRQSVSRDIADGIGIRELATGTILSVPGVVLLAMTTPMALVTALIGVVIAGLLFCGYVHRRIGGVTGDCLGFVCYLGQVLTLLAAAAHIPW